MLIIISFLAGYCFKTVDSHRSPKPSVNVYVYKETNQGIQLIYSGNVITDIGEKLPRDWLSGENATAYPVKWIALGNSSIAQTKTKLDTEATSTGFTRALGAITYGISGGDYYHNVTKKFTATGDIQINAASCHWSGTSDSDGNMYALTSLGGAQDFQNNWNCTITYMLVFDSN